MGFLEDRDLSDVPTIPEFYKDKTIFITGGSGFMGKVLIEKLLYSCSDLDRIYLLMRTKKGVKSEDRLADLYSSPCFDRLRKEKPTIFEEKVFVVAGDIMEIGLGLSQEDRALLVNRTNIIFHVAASVRFDDPLQYAARLNLRGTREIVELAKEVRELFALVHISTCYSNTNRKIVDEVMYPPHADWRETLRICEELDEQSIKVLTSKYLGEIPNTYTFSKQLAEHAVYEQRGDLPAVIIRPSIVISSVAEPVPGWIENFNGPVGILVACGKGLSGELVIHSDLNPFVGKVRIELGYHFSHLCFGGISLPFVKSRSIMRSIYSDPTLIADYMPVDISIKNFIAAAWIRGTKKLEKTDDIEIYNCCASNLNNITMGELVDLGKNIAKSYPLNDMLWNAGGSITTSATVHYIKVLTLHLLPAIFIDLLLWLLGKKTLLVKIQRRIYIANIALRYYVTQQWNFLNNNLILLRSKIKDEDQKEFFYEIETVDKYEYFRNSCIGGRRYLLKEKDEDLPKAKAHYRRMVILDHFVQCVFYGYVFWWILNTKFIQNEIHLVSDYVLNF